MRSGCKKICHAGLEASAANLLIIIWPWPRLVTEINDFLMNIMSTLSLDWNCTEFETEALKTYRSQETVGQVGVFSTHVRSRI